MSDITFRQIIQTDMQAIDALSQYASEIVKEVFDPIIGPQQNDYMIAMFQSVESIKEQLQHGYQYYNVYDNDTKIGFLAYVLKEDTFYISKFYLHQLHRGKGYAKQMFAFLCEQAQKAGYSRITLNVNRNNPAIHAYESFGMYIDHEEKNEIGHDFIMDDYVFAFDLQEC